MIRKAKTILNMVTKLLNDSMIYLPAVDVEKIAKQQNIQLRREDLKDISGLIFRDGNQVIIGVNERDAVNRQRFTIAHELGHFFLHTQNPLFIDKSIDKVATIKLRNQVSSEAVSLEEIEANAFAAELLMPTNMIFEEIKLVHKKVNFENDDLDQIITYMATRFEVSKQAMTIRLSNLGLFQD
jgi:Zn-dependent peptidase ImmA (M78 family)